MLVRIEECHCRMGDLTGRRWNAATTVGNLTRAARDAWKFRPLQARINCASTGFSRALSMRRTRWIRLGIYDHAGLADPGKCAGDPPATGLQREIQDHQAVLRTSLARGSGNYRLDGPSAWAV